jgi:NADH-quinone oxidoreductase subunit L
MEGPTPVSALIHAATMVTAGVFMLARMSPLFEYAPDALAVVCVVGALTAFVAATIGLTQFDIKRVIAYSTMSQLGYMFFAIGVSAYQAAIFHLLTHAFFKALLFLGAGSVIHAMGGEQDMRKMGGIWKLIPWTYALMWIGSLALAGIGIPGVFGFAGFYSKDMILEASWAAHTNVGAFAYWLGILAAVMTAFYSGRLLFLTFHGKPRADHHTMDHVHESPPVMLVPLLILGTGAVLAGLIGYDVFVGEGREHFWREAILVLHGQDSIEGAHHVALWVKLLPLVAGLVGLAASWLFYIQSPGLPGAVVRAFKPIHQLFFRKWYFDEIYDALFVKPAFVLGRVLWKGGDGAIIDRLGPDGIAATSIGIARRASRLESGYVYHYAFVMVIGVVALVSWYVFGGRI